MSDLPQGIKISRPQPTQSYRHAPNGDFFLRRERGMASRLFAALAAGVLLAVVLGVVGFLGATLYAIIIGPTVYDPMTGTYAVLVLALVAAITTALRFRFGVRTHDELSRVEDRLSYRDVITREPGSIHVDEVRRVGVRTLLVHTKKSHTDRPPRELVAFKGRDVVLVLETRDERVIGVLPISEMGTPMREADANKLVSWLSEELGLQRIA